MAKLPDFNPLIASDAICSTCGQTMEWDVERGPKGRAVRVRYFCVREETGCNYEVYSDLRLNGQASPIEAKSEKKAE